MKFLFSLICAFFFSATVFAAGGPQSLNALPNPRLAPAFTMKDVEGETHRLADYAGNPVIVNFWATWCPPCRAEMPSMQRAWEELRKEGIAMLAVNVGENEDKVFAFLADYPLDFPILFDRDSSVMKSWPVKGLPTTLVLDPQGRIVYRAVGGREWDDPALLQKVRDLQSDGP
jgi:peroxiredoxin